MCAARGVDRPEDLEPVMSGADYRRWIDYYAYGYEQQERISYLLGQVCSLLAGGFFQADSDPEDWIPGAAKAEPDRIHLSDDVLAMELARGLGAEIRYSSQQPL